MRDTIETCEVDECENDAYRICKTTDDNHKVIGVKAVCKEHTKSFILREADE